MEVLGHFIFELVKIAILASVYAYLVLLLFKFIGKKLNSGNWFESGTKNKKKFWFSSGFLISVSLFTFMFSYWGNHGFGDNAKIPIGNGYVVENINWVDCGYLNNIKTNDNFNIETSRFFIANGKLIGNLNESFYAYENSYFVFDLESKKIQEFKNVSSYNNYADKHNLPKTSEFLSFRENYHKRWSGWRLFLLP